MSELREAAQAVVDELADWISNGLIADLRAALAQPETDAPRDEWRPASEPPEDDRNVIVWYTPNDPTKGAPGGLFSGFFRDGEWWPYSGSETVTHWRDVQPPTEGKT